MKQLIYILLLVFAFSGAYSQKDPQARKILDKVSTQSQAEYPIQVSFEYIYEDMMDKQTSTRSGTLIIAEQKFRLTIGESVVYSDGITVWNHLTSTNEVYISDAEEGGATDEFFISDPSDLFTFYQEGFKYKLSGELEYDGQTYTEINIFPEDLDKNYHTVKLLINKKNNEIFSAQAYGKHGVNHTVMLTGYKKKVSTNDKTFVFDPEDHPEVEVIDTRF